MQHSPSLSTPMISHWEEIRWKSVNTAKLLGVTLDKNLTFSDHVDDVCSCLASKLYGMRVLKRLGMNSEGFKTYNTANIRSVLTYASPAWASLISDNNMTQLIQIEKSAKKIIDADLS